MMMFDFLFLPSPPPLLFPQVPVNINIASDGPYRCMLGWILLPLESFR